MKNKQSIKPIENNFILRTYTKEIYSIDLGTSNSATGLELTPSSFVSITLSSPISPITTGYTQAY